MDISIIIVNYNTVRLTQDCINSIFEQTKDVSFEVILVDNDSRDGSVEAFKSNPRITFIESGGNIGFGRANNIGIDKAKGKYLFLLNSDTVLLNNAPKIFFDKMEALPATVACVGTLLKGSEEEIIHSYGTFPTLSSELVLKTLQPLVNLLGVKLYPYDDPRLKKNTDFTVDYITGADLFIRREVVESCGYFDPDFFMYYEETELQYRFSLKGFSQMIVHGPSIIHLFGGSNKSSKGILEKRVLSLNSSFIYLKKRYNYIYYLIYRILLVVFSIPMLIVKKDTFSSKKKYLSILLK